MTPSLVWENALRDEQELLHRARQLEPAALGEIFDAYYGPLYRYIYHHLRHAATAEDLCGEAFARMLAHLSDGRGPRQHLRPWLYRVAHNLIVDESRRRVHRDHEPLSERLCAAAPGVEEQTETSIGQRRAIEALDALTERQRNVIILRYLEGLETWEIARTLGTTTGAVKALQRRGLEAMRRHLAQADVDAEGR
jgi:RNA polymerase sigma-70 factor (ECF subfamily)